MVEEGRRGRRRRLCGRPTLPESILASSSSASALTPCRPCSASVSPEGKKEEAERGGGRERQRVARWRRRDRTLSSLTEGKRETHSLLPRLLPRSLARCHMAIPRLLLLTTTAATITTSVRDFAYVAELAGLRIGPERNGFEIAEKVRGELFERANERTSERGHMSTRLPPSVRPSSVFVSTCGR